jgi:hypothetical protein
MFMLTELTEHEKRARQMALKIQALLLGQAQKCGGVKSANVFSTLPS